MPGVALVGEQAAVDPRVERLHPAVEHLGEPGHVFDARHLQSCVADRGRGAAGGDERDATLGEPPREVHHTGLVVDGEQGPPYLANVAQDGPPSIVTFRPSIRRRPSTNAAVAAGRRRCSTSWTRASNESQSSSSRTSNASCITIGPVSTPSSTRITVTPVTFEP